MVVGCREGGRGRERREGEGGGRGGEEGGELTTKAYQPAPSSPVPSSMSSTSRFSMGILPLNSRGRLRGLQGRGSREEGEEGRRGRGEEGKREQRGQQSYLTTFDQILLQ